MNFQKTLYLLCLVFLGDLIQNIKCAGVDDNEITEYQEPVNSKIIKNNKIKLVS